MLAVCASVLCESAARYRLCVRQDDGPCDVLQYSWTGRYGTDCKYRTKNVVIMRLELHSIHSTEHLYCCSRHSVGALPPYKKARMHDVMAVAISVCD